MMRYIQYQSSLHASSALTLTLALSARSPLHIYSGVTEHAQTTCTVDVHYRVKAVRAQ